MAEITDVSGEVRSSLHQKPTNTNVQIIIWKIQQILKQKQNKNKTKTHTINRNTDQSIENDPIKAQKYINIFI